jgi:tetratricopeptide (TPR) repeat protein
LAAVSLTHGLRDWQDPSRPKLQLFLDGPLTEPGPLLELIADEEYLTVECTGFAQSQSLSESVPEGVGRTAEGLLPFERAVAAGREQLERPDRPFRFALDIAIAHYQWRIENTVHQMETKINQGSYVDRQVITNNILVLGDPHALDEVLRSLSAKQGIDKQALKNLGALAVPDHVSNQIAEVMAAQKEVAAQGMPATPQTSYHLGMLAAYRRDYDAALDYFRQAMRADPEYSRSRGIFLRGLIAAAPHKYWEKTLGPRANLRQEHACAGSDA